MESTLNDKIHKTVVTPGIGDQPTFSTGTKVSFHFVTRLINGDVIDDSYKWPKHMEIVLGKKFKLEVWETVLKSMREKEISKFVVHKSLVTSYPFVSKTLRDANQSKKPKTTSHCCTAQLQQNGMGYDDLNNLLAEPVDLEFTIELLKVESPGTFEKDTWLMNEEEKRIQIPILKETGNQFYNQGMYKEAEEKYMIALGFLEQIMIKLKPREDEWNELNDIKIPLLLNLAQCKLIAKEYYQVIEHCTTILNDNPSNVKALFRRGKANISVWKMDEAKEDLKKLVNLDPSMQGTVNRLLVQINEAIKKKNDEDRQNLRGKLF